MVRCASCGAENPPGFRFCGSCGASLAPAATTARDVRKTVTVLFCDLAGSTGLGERLDPEALRQVMSRYYDRMRGVLERHGGTVEKFIGDAVMAVFGVPVVHEDDALRAVRAALQMRDALAALNEELDLRWGVTLQTRTGVNTGEVVTGQGAGETLATGDAVNVAARLEHAAGPGEIVLGDVTYRLVRDRVDVEPMDALDLRGKTVPVRAWRLLGPREMSADARLEAPMVGRDRELRRLRQAWSDAGSDRHCELFTVLGTAGVGKSRLVREFLASIGDEATVLRGRCLPYGEGITYWPLGEALRDRAGIVDADDARTAQERLQALVAGHPEEERLLAAVSDAVGLRTGGSSTDEIAWAARRTLEWLASERPLVAVFDDIHWAEPAFLDLVEHVADWSRDQPILLLCMARPELLEARPSWGGGKLHASTVLLEPLGARATGELVEHLVGGVGLDERVRARIVDAAEGNPLFVEEMIGMLVDDGLLQRVDGRWAVTGDLSLVDVPPSVKALLAARLDRLAPEERAVAERGSVVGRIFERRAVAALAPEPLRATVSVHLLSLVRKELVRPEDASLPGDEAYRFRHVLIRDAAYESLPKQERAELHERFARWLEAAVTDRVAEYEEVIAYHLEQAHRYRREVGLDDGVTARLASDAGERLHRAARRAGGRGDATARRTLLRRAAVMLPPHHADRGALLTELVDTLVDAAAFDEAREVMDEAQRLVEERGDEALAASMDLRRFYADAITRPLETLGGDEERIARAIDTLVRHGRHADQAYGLLVLAQLHSHRGDIDQMAPLARAAVEAAERAGDHRMALEAGSMVVSAAYWGTTPVEEALALAREHLEQTRAFGDRYAEARTIAMIGRMEALRGDVETGRRLVSQSRATIEELGVTITVAGSSQWVSAVEWFGGTPERAEQALREADAMMERLGERSHRSTVDSDLAHALIATGDLDEAERFADLALELGTTDDVSSQGSGRMAKARILARRGRHVEAIAMAEEAAAIVLGTQYVTEHVRSHESLAEIHELARDVERAREHLAAAIGSLEAMGARPWADRLRGRLDELGRH